MCHDEKPVRLCHCAADCVEYGADAVLSVEGVAQKAEQHGPSIVSCLSRSGDGRVVELEDEQTQQVAICCFFRCRVERSLKAKDIVEGSDSFIGFIAKNEESLCWSMGCVSTYCGLVSDPGAF